MQSSLVGNALHVQCTVLPLEVGSLATKYTRGPSARCKSASSNFTSLEKTNLKNDLFTRRLSDNGSKEKLLARLQAAENPAVGISDGNLVEEIDSSNTNNNGSSNSSIVPKEEADVQQAQVTGDNNFSSTSEKPEFKRSLTFSNQKKVFDAYDSSATVAERLNRKRVTIAGMEEFWATAALVTSRLNRKRLTIRGMEEVWAAAKLIAVARTLRYNVLQGRDEATQAAIIVTTAINALWEEERTSESSSSSSRIANRNGTEPTSKASAVQEVSQSSAGDTVAKRSASVVVEEMENDVRVAAVSSDGRAAWAFVGALIKALGLGIQAIFNTVAQKAK